MRAQQQAKAWRVGFLSTRHADFVDTDFAYGPFKQGMRELGPKLLEMLRDIAPKISRVAVLANPTNVSNVALLKNTQAAAHKIGVTIQPIEASTLQHISVVFAAMECQNTSALIVSPDALFQQQKNQIAELATKYRLPSIGTFSEYAEAGGLMSYGQNIRENYKRAATYVDKIFKGAKPGGLPVEQPTKFEMVVNLKTAKALGLKVPPVTIVQATKVIE